MRYKLLIIILFLLFSFSIAYGEDDFRIVLFPDTQYETDEPNDPAWLSIWNWVINNRANLNIKAAVGLGDVAEYASYLVYAIDGWNALLATELVTVPAPGNHDADDYAWDFTTWNTHFPVSNFSGKSWYGGCLNDLLTNWYTKFEIGNQKFMILVLEVYARTASRDWANTILAQNTDRATILITHQYLQADGTRFSIGDTIWNTVVKNNRQIFLVACGHDNAGNHSYRVDQNDYGDNVSQLFLAYHGGGVGNGYFGILTFHGDTVGVTVYSDYLQQYDPEVNYQFEYRFGVGNLTKANVGISVYGITIR